MRAFNTFFEVSPNAEQYFQLGICAITLACPSSAKKIGKITRGKGRK